MLTYAEESPRVIWKSSINFVLVLVTVCVGIGNILAFPTRAYQYGGGTFILSYLVCALFFGLPILYLELIIGQYHRCCPLVFMRRCAPILMGLGWLFTVGGIIMITLFQGALDSLLSLLILMCTSGDDLTVWTKCNNSWNKNDTCFEFFEKSCALNNNSEFNMFKSTCVNKKFVIDNGLSAAGHQYLASVVRDKSDMGVFYCMMAILSLIAFIHNRGISKFPHILVFPNIVTFIVLPFFMVRSLSLDGSWTGISYLLTVDWNILFTWEIWFTSLEQVMFSLSLGFGIHTTLASFAPPYANTYMIALFTVSFDTLFSLFATVTVFATIGHIMDKTHVDILEVFPNPDSSTFVHSFLPVLAHGITNNHFLWLFLFYFTCTLMSCATIYALIVPISVTISDAWNISSKSQMFNIISVIVCVLLALIQSLMLFDKFLIVETVFPQVGTALQASFIVIQLLVISEQYGVSTVYNEIHVIMGRPTKMIWSKFGGSSPIWRTLWKTCPAFAVLIFLNSFQNIMPNRVANDNDESFFQIRFKAFEILSFFLLYAIVPACALHAHVSMQQHFFNYEQKEYNWRCLFLRQKHLRSWLRISRKLKKRNMDLYKKHEEILPEIEPEDLEMYWKLIYRQFFTVKIKGENLQKRKRGQKRVVSEREPCFEAGIGINGQMERTPAKIGGESREVVGNPPQQTPIARTANSKSSEAAVTPQQLTEKKSTPNRTAANSMETAMTRSAKKSTPNRTAVNSRSSETTVTPIPRKATPYRNKSTETAVTPNLQSARKKNAATKKTLDTTEQTSAASRKKIRKDTKTEKNTKSLAETTQED